MFSYIPALLAFLLCFSAQAKNLAVISYSGAKGPVKVPILLKEFKDTYRAVKEMAPNTPPIKQFFEEYLRYRVGVEAAYNDKSLIKNPSIRNMFASPLLKESFEQSLYKHFADKKLKKKVAKIDRATQKLSKSLMLKFYRKNPEFDFYFIVISFPVNSTPAQIKTARARAMKIHSEVKKSKKSFPDLVDIYSDNRLAGRINAPRSRHNIHPSLYDHLKKMKSGQISPPIKSSAGFYILKLNRKMPFGEANRAQIRASYFDWQRNQAMTRYFNSLKSKYKVQTNKALLNSL